MSIKKSSFLILFIVTIFVSSTPVKAEKLKRSLFKVEQMTCNACVSKVYNRLMKLDGYEGMLVNIEKKLIAVDHQEKLMPDSILSAMAEINKPANPIQPSRIASSTSISATMPGWQKQSDGWLSKLFRMFDL